MLNLYTVFVAAFFHSLLLIFFTIACLNQQPAKTTKMPLVEKMTTKSSKIDRVSAQKNVIGKTDEKSINRNSKTIISTPKTKALQFEKLKVSSDEVDVEPEHSFYAYEINGKWHHVNLSSNRPHVTRSGVV
ncbi:hypothetical protein M3Y96_00417100 [Aphelenchoides besseyi]|nr:hypothetical protein M3Y96_00417100 [Aphelenchoides besseyi]